MAEEETAYPWRLLALERDRDEIFRRLRDLELTQSVAVTQLSADIKNIVDDVREMKSASERAAREAVATREAAEDNRSKALEERKKERRGYYWALGVATFSVLLSVILTHFLWPVKVQ